MSQGAYKLDTPIDVMYLLHKALRCEAARVEQMSEALEVGGSFSAITQAFHQWEHALGYHAVAEDTHMTPKLPDTPLVRENEASHAQLEARLADIQKYLQEIGSSPVDTRTKRHLFGKLVDLHIAQDDHLEEEEELVLPLIRQRMDETQQLEVVRCLVLDLEAQDTGWILAWLRPSLTPMEQQWLEELTRPLAAKLPPGAA